MEILEKYPELREVIEDNPGVANFVINNSQKIESEYLLVDVLRRVSPLSDMLKGYSDIRVLYSRNVDEQFTFDSTIESLFVGAGDKSVECFMYIGESAGNVVIGDFYDSGNNRGYGIAKQGESFFVKSKIINSGNIAIDQPYIFFKREVSNGILYSKDYVTWNALINLENRGYTGLGSSSSGGGWGQSNQYSAFPFEATIIMVTK